jgi:Piwi domain
MGSSRPIIRLNGFLLSFDVEKFEVFESVAGEDLDLRQQRLASPGLRLFKDGSTLVSVRTGDHSPNPSGERRMRVTKDSFPLLKWLVDEELPRTFSAYEPTKRHPFGFVGTQRDLIAEISNDFGKSSDRLDGFRIRPQYELNSRVVAFRGSEPRLGLFVSIRTRWEIDRPILDLHKAGVDLKGLYVVSRNALPGQRRLVGQISQLRDDTVDLSDVFDGATSFSADEIALEGSRRNFVRCVQTILGANYERFEGLRSKRANAWLSPSAIDLEVEKIGNFIAKRSITINSEIAANVEERIELPRNGSRPNVRAISTVQYCFDAARTKQDRVAWTGLNRFGPYSRDTFSKKSPRILVIFPDILQGRVESFLKAFRDGFTGAMPTAYAAGFAKTFDLVDPNFKLLAVPWNGNESPANRYRHEIETQLATPGQHFDAAIVVLRDEDARLPDSQNPYLHSKALLLVAGIPTQQLLQATISDQRGLPYTLRNISTAIYAKLGGTPWTVNHDLTISDEVVVGIGVAELAESRFVERQRYVGVTTVFRGDGNYLLGNLSRECSFEEYPEVLRKSTTQVLQEIKLRNGWQIGDTVRVVCHAHRPLRDVETAKIMADCVKAVGQDQTVEFAFLTISQEHPFTLIDPEQRGFKQGKGALVPDRGTVVNLSSKARLLSVTGPSLLLTNPAPLPDPLLISLHRSSTFKDLDYLTEQILKFTALSWRSVLPGRQPVTILYSELIAELLGRLRSVREWSTAPLNTTLRSSRWFL